jgi:hypothetical protein
MPEILGRVRGGVPGQALGAALTEKAGAALAALVSR